MGLDDATLVKRHTEHAQKVQRPKKVQEVDHRDRQTHQAQLTMLQAVAGEPEARGEGRGRGRGGGRGGAHGHQGWSSGTTACFHCGKEGHWFREHPERRGPSHQPRQN